MYKESYRFRLLPGGSTGSALVFSKPAAIGQQVDFLKADLDGRPLCLATDMPWGQPYQSSIAIKDQLLRVLNVPEHSLEVDKTALGPGQYHPRVWRKINLFGPTKAYQREFAVTIQSLSNLFIQSADVYRYIEPSRKNANAFGHRIREILILASTEVESAWKAILVANNKASSAGALRTSDYVKLLPVLRLNEWEIRMSNYPDFPSFRPFGDWSASNPTKSLSWYDAYNAVKHDREANFSEAKLECMVQSLGACFVMLLAQFGSPNAYFHDSHYPMPFAVVTEPDWPLTEQYMAPYSLPWHSIDWSSVTF